jgi:hypothetical protein
MDRVRSIIGCLVLLAFPVWGGEAISDALAEMSHANYSAAAAIWKKLIADEPEYVAAMNNLGYCQVMLGDFNRGADQYLRADAISQNLNSKAGAQWAYLAAGNYGDSIQWGKAALAIDPNNYWVRLRLAMAYSAIDDSNTAEKFYFDLIDTHGARTVKGLPTAQIIPFYQSTTFSGSSYKTSGFDVGGFALWNFQSGFTLGAGFTRDAMATPEAATDYKTNEFRLMTGFLLSDLSTINLTGHFLTSNYDYINKAATVSLGYTPAGITGFSISADALIFPQHGGLSASPQYTWALGGPFFLRLGGTAQFIGFAQVTRTYAAAQGALLMCRSYFCLTMGGLYGNLFTPLLDGGSILVYNPDELRGQAFAKVSVRMNSLLEISGAYTYARWSSLNGETPTSGTVSIVATGSF